MRHLALALILCSVGCSTADSSPPDQEVPGDTDSPGDGDTSGVSAAPSFDPAPGLYAYGTDITLTSPDAGSVIYFTLDGSTPTATSDVYDGTPLTLRQALSVKAMAIAGDAAPSGVVQGDYSLENGVIIHFKKPAEWANAYIHYWATEPSGLQTVWPGEAMKPEGNGWYYFTFKDQTAVHIVFNGGNSPQTADLYWSKPQGWFMDDDFWDIDPAVWKLVAFPGGKLKALVMSYDDVPTQDRDLVAMFNDHGIKGTFHLNSGLMGNPDKIPASDIAEVYAGHEVSVHSRTHPNLENLNATDLRNEMQGDREALEALVGYPVRGAAYPFGSYNSTLLGLMSDFGLEYGRVVPTVGDYRLPADPYLWRGTAHHSAAWDPAAQFVNATFTEPKLLFIWGHSWELDGGQPGNSWEHMEALCELVSGHDDIWYAHAIEIIDFMNAVRRLQLSADGKTVTNGAGTPVWVRSQGSLVELPPGEAVLR